MPQALATQPTPRVVVLDVESTGKDRAADQIIEICLRFGIEPDAESRTWRIRPAIAIHPEATRVHGITAEDLADCAPFVVVAAEFRPLLDAADVLVGFNVAFDLDMLQAELARAALPVLDFADKKVVCALRLWHHVEPRTLVAAHVKFCGEVMIDAHQAEADVAATARVLTAMLTTFGLADKTWPEIAALSDPFKGREAWIGPTQHVQWDDNGAVVLAFGKHKGERLDQVELGFLRWVLKKDFPPHVKAICHAAGVARAEQQQALKRGETCAQFANWISARYRRPVPQEIAP
jgi:DNA polymerase-3 subunit epsilon